MPTLMSVNRPAAFNRGATANPKSAALISRPRPADWSNARIPGTERPGANPAQPLRNQDPVVAIQWHHVGNRPERHQIEQIGDPKFIASDPRAPQ